jgi:hypothetical protein
MDDTQDHAEGHSPSGGGLVALAQRFIVAALKTSGNERLERIGSFIKEAPEVLGKKTGHLLQRLLDKKSRGEVLTARDEEELGEALQERPSEAAAVLGLVTADLLQGTLDADGEREAIIGSYASILNFVCAYMAEATTSVAIRGFLHDPACISYWHVERRNLEFAKSGSDYLYPNGLEVYLFDEEATDERLAALNMAIRDSPTRHLHPAMYDISSDDAVAKVTRINETTIVIERLHPDRASLPAAPEDPLFGRKLGTDYSRPLEFVLPIPPDATDVVALIDSLQKAKAVQSHRLQQSRKNKGKIVGS